MESISLKPIGMAWSSRKAVVDDHWDSETVRVELDPIDGTPILDIKPWVREFAPRGKVFQPPWISELMREYW